MRSVAVLAIALVAGVPAVVHGQLRKLRLVSTDSQPVVYANVSIEGGTTQITDENGEVGLGAGKRQTLTMNIRRIGFVPWFGKVELPDTAAVLTITLSHVAQSLEEVKVTGQHNASSPYVQGFYDRWMMRQNGVLSATFIGPEEHGSGFRARSPIC